MPRKEREAVPEGSGPVPQQEEFGSGEPTLADVYRLFEEKFDQQQKRMASFFDGMASCFGRWNRELDEISDQHVTSLEHGAWQLRLAMEADGQANTRLARARRPPQQQYRQRVGMAFLHAGLKSARTPT